MPRFLSLNPGFCLQRTMLLSECLDGPAVICLSHFLWHVGRFSPILKTKRVTLSENGAVATCDGHDHVRHHVFSENVYSSSVFRFR